MYRFKKILVGLAKNEHDPVILQYAGWLSRIAKSQKMILFHVVEKPDSSCLPSEYAECFESPEPLSPGKWRSLLANIWPAIPKWSKSSKSLKAILS